jgi:hypothetical protein
VGCFAFQWDVWHIVFDGIPDFVLTFGTAKPTDVKIVGLVPSNVMTHVGLYGYVLTFGMADFCRFGHTKRHSPRWDMLGILHFNGMFGIS